MEILKTGWWTGEQCARFRRVVDKEVQRPPSSISYFGAHARLALRRLPYAAFLAPIQESAERAGHFPEEYWDRDGWGLWDAGYGVLLGPGDVAVDAGAGLGLHTRLLALAVGAGGEVHSFEPFRIAFQTLNANVVLAGLTSVFSYQKALSDCQAPGFRSGRPWLEDIGEDSEVECTTLDDLRLQKVDFVRFDVGRDALTALVGAARTLKRTLPTIMLASLGHTERREAVLGLIAGVLGYICIGVRSTWPTDVLCYHPRRLQYGSGQKKISRAIEVWTTARAHEHCQPCRLTQPLPVGAGSVEDLMGLAPGLNTVLPELQQ